MTFSSPTPTEPPIAKVEVKHRRFAFIWLIPIIATLIAGYLGIRAYKEHGPVITLTFNSGDGLTASQTAVKYKSVNLGIVEDVALTEDMKHVMAHVRMSTKAEPLLTEHTRFWVVKPRLNSTNISDLEPLVSGTYIALSPGEPGGQPQTHFTGLENPPGLQADGAGTIYLLKTDTLGSIREGSTVYYRDIDVGQVLNSDLGDGYQPLTLTLFIRAPYNKFVKPSSHFWNASGLSVKMGGGGLKVELQSIQSVLSGGIAFDTPQDAHDVPAAQDKTVFELYEDKKTADAAIYDKRVPYVTYFQTSIKDLEPGSPVQIFGIPVGAVTEVKLVYDKDHVDTKVRVAFDLYPQRAFGSYASNAGLDPMQITRQLVQKGMRVKLESSNIIAGQEVLALEFVPKTEPAEVALEGDAMVVPGITGGFDNLADALGDVAGKLNQIPFDEIGKNLNHLITSADQTFVGPEMKQAIHSLAATLANAEDLTHKADDNLTPALQRLPDISAQLQSAVAHANQLMTSMDNTYGTNSDFSRSAKRVMDEVNDAVRSIRLLADFLDRHPEALVRGKTIERTKP